MSTLACLHKIELFKANVHMLCQVQLDLTFFSG